MNQLDIPASVTERVLRRYGVEHPHADLNPGKTALVVIDLQNAFMDDTVGHAVCPAARDIVPEVNRLAAAVRATGGGVFWIKNTHDDRSALEWSNGDAMLSPAMRAHRAAAMSEDPKVTICGPNWTSDPRMKSSANTASAHFCQELRNYRTGCAHAVSIPC